MKNLPRTHFSKDLSLQVWHLISFQKYKFTVFGIFLDYNVMVAIQYLKIMIIFKNFLEKKSLTEQ